MLKYPLGLFAAILLASPAAQAWSIGSQLDNEGCHERITANALRAVRARFATSPAIPPTRNEIALIDTVQFVPPADFRDDLAAVSLLIAVRDNDLKGSNPLDTIDLVAVHGDPATQQEHCIRGPNDDGYEGNETALAACRDFIRMRVLEALDGLAADGTVDGSLRMPLAVYLSFAGHSDPELPVFYVKMGQAMHALEDGFTHVYRDPEGVNVTVVTNWIDNISGTAAAPERDGPIHLFALDECDNTDALVQRNVAAATEAVTELLAIALDPALSREAKAAAVDATTTKYLTYEAGCTVENNFCDAREPEVVGGCSTSGGAGGAAVVVLGSLIVLLRRRRVALAAVTICSLAMPAFADEPTPAATEAPAVPVVPQQPEDSEAARKGEEPGRDEKTPTVADVASIRQDKRLGSKFGFAAMVGGSVDHAGGAIVVAGRYRISERWVVGLDAEWNPWVTSVPLEVKAGVASAYATLIRRFPMKFDRVNLRTSVHLGTSMLLFDVFGAPKHEIGLFGAFTPLGIDYDLGKSVRLVLDPVQIALPMPHIGAIPLYYEQFRLMIGIQIGA
ncbi:MAG: MYXO-CTERM sorting domain-containing protein [Kofleriaceae bacterium]